MVAVSLVIPTYNERDNISILAEDIFAIFEKNNIDAELIIVDDNSPDGTGKIADELAKRYNILVIHRSGKLGLSSAVLEGFKISKGFILGAMDADFSHPIDAIPELLKPLLDNHAEISIGSRYISEGRIENWPSIRRITSKGATLLAKPLTKVKDPMSGFFFIKKDVIFGKKLNPRGYKIALEILVKGSYKNVVEVPIVFTNRKKGKSKLNLKEYLNFIFDLFGLYIYKIKH